MKKGEDYIGVGVGAVIIKGGKFLIQKRVMSVNMEKSKWEIPGVSIEYGEAHKEALKREIREEMGIEIELIELLNVVDHISPTEKQHWIATIYICKIISGTPQIMEPQKADDMRWVTLSEAKKLDLAPITANDVKILEKRFPKGLIV